MSWQQEGWLVLADAGMPLFHGFFLTRWEAENKLKEVQALPEAELRYGATIVPARLWFDWRGTPRSAQETGVAPKFGCPHSHTSKPCPKCAS